MLRSALLALVAGLAFVSNASAVPILVDSFTDARPVATGNMGGLLSDSSNFFFGRVFSTPGSATLTETGLSGVLGGTRTTNLNVAVANGAAGDNYALGVNPSTSRISLQTGSTAKGSFTLNYNFASSPLNFNNFSGVSLDLLTTDVSGAAGTMFTVTLIDGGSASATQTLSGGQAGTTLNFTNGSFVQNGSTPFNASQIVGLQVVVNTNNAAGADLSFGNLQFATNVPEPMTLATFGALALFGGYAARRKLKVHTAA